MNRRHASSKERLIKHLDRDDQNVKDGPLLRTRESLGRRKPQTARLARGCETRWSGQTGRRRRASRRGRGARGRLGTRQGQTTGLRETSKGGGLLRESQTARLR